MPREDQFWNCSACGRANWPASRECIWCAGAAESSAPPEGAPEGVPAYCAACGAPNPPAGERCRHCGRPLRPPAAPAPSRPAPPDPETLADYGRDQLRKVSVETYVCALGLALVGLLTGWLGHAAFWWWGATLGLGDPSLLALLLGEGLILTGLLLVLVGNGLRDRQHWARIAGIVLGCLLLVPWAGCLALFTVPVGVFLLARFTQRSLSLALRPRR